jgi:thiamine pyrophosphate-dependent acetolactate synthase large subunit-like protein
VFDNEHLYGSRGGPRSQTATGTNIAAMAKACGLESVRMVREKNLLHSEMHAFLASDGPSLLVAKIQAIGRGAGPNMDGQENKYKFVRHVERIAGIEILGAPKP